MKIITTVTTATVKGGMNYNANDKENIFYYFSEWQKAAGREEEK